MHSFIHSVGALFLLFLLCQPAQAGDIPETGGQAVVLAASAPPFPRPCPGSSTSVTGSSANTRRRR